MINAFIGFLIVYSVTITFLAIHWYQQRNDARVANNIRFASIEMTRKGHPPFLLNKGVRIVIDEEK